MSPSYDPTLKTLVEASPAYWLSLTYQAIIRKGRLSEASQILLDLGEKTVR